MFGQTSLGNTALSDSDNRVFRVEVKGLRQTYQSDKLTYPIRRSGSSFISVPYGRMSEEMQRINRLGGKIVSIEPLTLDGNNQAKSQATAANQTLDAKGKSKATGADKTGADKSDKSKG